MPITKKTYEVGRQKSAFSIDSLNDKRDRTLLYGYTLDRDTHHVYVKNGEIHLFIYDNDYASNKIKTVFYKKGKFSSIDDLIPSKRTYPESTDEEFFYILSTLGVNGNFTTYSEERYEKIKDLQFQGEIFEDIE